MFDEGVEAIYGNVFCSDICSKIVLCSQAKILDHDNVNNLKKILGELAMVLDQVEAELEKGKLEYEGQCIKSLLLSHLYLMCFVYVLCLKLLLSSTLCRSKV